jgi:hypothetical protein
VVDSKKSLDHLSHLWLALLVVISLWGSDETASSELPLQADRILILKSERKLKLLHDGAVLSWFWIALGRVPEGPKVASGDGRTPEGLYVIDGRDLYLLLSQLCTVSRGDG